MDQITDALEAENRKLKLVAHRELRKQGKEGRSSSSLNQLALMSTPLRSGRFYHFWGEIAGLR